MLPLRARFPKQATPQSLSFSLDAAWSEVLAALIQQSGVPEHQIRVLSGFPPKPFEPSHGVLLKDCGLRENEMLTIQEGGPRVQLVNTGERYVPIAHERAHFRRRECPADNSCLFHACSYILKNKSRLDGPALRMECAQYVLDHRNDFRTLTGEDPDKYVPWIVQKDSWGGYIELVILSRLYETEIIALDLTSSSVIRCGSENNYPVRGYVVFTGQHYDAIAMSTANSLIDESHDQVLFNPRDESVFARAKEFVKEEGKKPVKA